VFTNTMSHFGRTGRRHVEHHLESPARIQWQDSIRLFPNAVFFDAHTQNNKRTVRPRGKHKHNTHSAGSDRWGPILKDNFLVASDEVSRVAGLSNWFRYAAADIRTGRRFSKYASRSTIRIPLAPVAGQASTSGGPGMRGYFHPHPFFQ